MRVLGLNGWPQGAHDAAACLLVDGEIAAFAEEERFIRRKHAFATAAHHAAAFCLNRGGISVEDLDAVAFGWQMPELYRLHGLQWTHSDAQALEILLPRSLFPRRTDPPLYFIRHHLAHAASAFYFSGQPNGAILVIDGQGEQQSATLAAGDGAEIRILETVPTAWSLGYFYQAVCEYVGLGFSDPGKLMGLAAHGTPRDETFQTFEFQHDGYVIQHLPPDVLVKGSTDEEVAVVVAWLNHLARTLKSPPNMRVARYDPASSRFQATPPRDPYEYRDVAAGGQAALERAVMALAHRAIAVAGYGSLHVAGGVAFNATVNGKLLRHPAVRNLFVQPLAGDAGVSLGAAAVVARDGGDEIKPLGKCLAWGPSFDPDLIRATLARTGLSFVESPDPARDAARLIAGGAVVGWFQGAAEGGPRALGHRSIVARPATVTGRDHINRDIKQREWWRPLAPSVTEEFSSNLLDAAVALPFMVMTVPVCEDVREDFAAVVHVDGTTRPQTVARDEDPLYHQLLSEVGERTGDPVVLNTSFNGKDEPIVCTPTEALLTFARTPLDALVAGPFIAQKP